MHVLSQTKYFARASVIFLDSNLSRIVNMFQNGSNLECFILLYSNFEVVEHMQLCYQTVKKKKLKSQLNVWGPQHKKVVEKEGWSSSPMKKGWRSLACLVWRRGGSQETSLWPSSIWAKLMSRREINFLHGSVVIEQGGMV